MKQQYWLLTLVTLLAPLILTEPVKALSIVDDAVLGAQSILRDNGTSLDWLRLGASDTIGKSYSEVSSLLSVPKYDSFRFATVDEMNSLWTSNTEDSSSPYYVSSISALIDDLQLTGSQTTGDPALGSWSDSKWTRGFLDPGDPIEIPDPFILGAYRLIYTIPVAEIWHFALFNNFPTLPGSATGGYGLTSLTHTVYPGAPPDSTAEEFTGAFLVRATPGIEPIPEPSTFLLLSGGLVGLAFVARRRRKN